MRIKKIYKNWDWVLFSFIILYMIIPQVYRSYSIYLIGNKIPSTSSLAIVSQWQFIQILFEIIQEASVLPIFYFVGKNINKNPKKIIDSVKTSYIFIIVLHIFVLIFLQVFLEQFINIIGTSNEIVNITEYYLRIKLFGILFSVLSLGSIVIIQSLKIRKVLLTITFVKLLLSIIFDSIFYGGYSFSLNLGVLGVAWSNLIVDILIFLLSVYLVIKNLNITFSDLFNRPLLKNIKIITKIGIGSGIDSAVRNIAYIFLIIKMLNILGTDQIGGYYLSMHIFWSFALVPILALSETSKVLIANNSYNKVKIKNILYSALIITTFVILIWIILSPFWKNIALFLNKNNEVVSYSYKAFMYLFIPYILLAFNTIIDSLFYGIGKTKFMAYQSIITNGTVYLGAYILYKNNIWIPDFRSIMILFGLGLFVDSILTVIFANQVLKNYNKKSLSNKTRLQHLA